ncbi:MAG: hypothetical protein ACTSW4_00665 [Candidatus Ranarchaeia archaeon]
MLRRPALSSFLVEWGSIFTIVLGLFAACISILLFVDWVLKGYMGISYPIIYGVDILLDLGASVVGWSIYRQHLPRSTQELMANRMHLIVYGILITILGIVGHPVYWRPPQPYLFAGVAIILAGLLSTPTKSSK